MRILFLSVFYRPDRGPAAPLFTMLSEALVQRGHMVTVVTTVPHYPSGEVPSAYKGWSIRKSVENGVCVIRLPLPSVNWKSFTARIVQLVIYQILATLSILKLDFDVVLTHNAAFGVWLPFGWSAVLRRKPAVFSVQDVYPDVGVTLGVFRYKSIIKAVASIERFCLDHSAIVQIISDSFRPGLQALGVPDTKMVLVHNWVDTELIQPLPKENTFSREFYLQDCFVVLYAGNLGLSQGLEHVLTAAWQLADHSDIKFVFVGEGTGREQIVAEAERRQLPNVQFLPFQPRSRLPEVLASADVSLVTLRRGVGTNSLPSKTFSIMASGRPILVSVDEESEAWKLVKRAEAGVWVPPEAPSKLAEAILTLKNDKALRELLGRNGRVWAEQHHSPQYAAEQFEKLLVEAISSNKKRH